MSFQSLSYHQLQAQCQKLGLPAQGKATELRQRLCAWSESNAQEAKRRKTSVEDGLVCPISLELPFDPVMAEDGHIYERASIEGYISSRANRKKSKVTSPMTCEPMGQQLIPARQHKNTIEALITSGTIKGEVADKWMEKLEESRHKKYAEETLKAAEQGDLSAMETAAVNFVDGKYGFEYAPEKAFLWYKRAHAAGSILGTAMMGDMLIAGLGVPENVQKGTMFLGIAAGMGSDFAAYNLGEFLAGGLHGFSVDLRESRRWLEKSLSDSCPHKHMDDEMIDDCKEKLAEVVSKIARGSASA